MSSTISLTGDWLVSIGNIRQTRGTGNLGVYATNGVAVSAAQVGLGVITSLLINPAGGYTFTYDPSTGKVLAYAASSGSFTATGTNSKPTFTVEASGAIGTDMEVGLSADANSATFEGGTGISAQRVLTTTSPVGTPTFTGDAVAVDVAEVDNSTNLSGVTFSFVAQGY